MEQAANFLMWLFDETRRYHAQLDRHVHVLIADTLTIERYRETLIRIYGFEAPLEGALAYTPGFTAVCDVRPRAGLIVRDLLSLGMRPSQIAALPQCAIAPFATPAIAMGWHYIYERSRLPHPLVCTHVLEALPEAKSACEYFCRDDLAVGERWDEFAAALERMADVRELRHGIRDGAIAACECAIAWYDDESLAAVAGS